MIKQKEVLEFLNLTDFVSKKILLRGEDNVYTLDLELLKIHSHEAYDYFLDHPEEFKQLMLEKLGLFNNKKAYFKIQNFSYLHPISTLRVEHINKLVRVVGMITKTTKVIAIVTSRKFECPSCGTVLTVQGSKEPKRCSCGRRGMFTILSTDFTDIQELEIEELQEDLGDRQPQKVRVRVLGDLCDKNISGNLQPGNKLEVIGRVQEVETTNTKAKQQQEEIFEYRVEAYDLNILEERLEEVDITEEDENQILEIAAKDPLTTLANNLAPSIYGHIEVKKALVLQMVGGVSEIGSDGLPSRDRINLLICGDGSVGKSQMAKNVHKKMPKSYYVSGDEASKVGLTAMADKDPLLGNWSLKAGALCKCNGSILVIDEMDKIAKEDLNALHTPMESGEIIVDKADIHSVLKANCSILAVCNPKSGMFQTSDPNLSITSQIDIPPPLMTRFDLIFAMIDNIDEERDSEIVRKIFFNGKSNENQITISPELFRKYVVYAKRLKPTKSEEDLPDLIKFYNEMRRMSITADSKIKAMPIATRHIQGILRLAAAHAKIRLSKKIEKQDLDVAKELFKESLIKLGMDSGLGIIDFARIGAGKTANIRIKYKLIVEVLRQVLEEQQTESVTDFHLRQKCREKGINDLEYEKLTEEINRAGEILRAGNGYWKLP